MEHKMRTSLLYIYKDGSDILWKTEPLVGLPLCITRASVKDADRIVCYECDKPLREINGETDGKWVCYNSEYRCPPCFIACETTIKARIYKEEDLKKKMPRLIADVLEMIASHRNYKELDICTRMQYDQCFIERTSANNKYVRNLWRHLYHDQAKPL